jgi:protein-tyrosine phosphatase
MKAEIYWVDAALAGRLAIMPRPRGGEWLEDEMRSLQRDGVEILISLLTHDEEVELDLLAESAACKKAGIELRSLPIRDRAVPNMKSAGPLVRALAKELQAGRGIAIHCRAGIGRSATIAAAILSETGMALGDRASKGGG